MTRPLRLLALLGLVVALAACKDDPSPIAVLRETSAGTEHEVGGAPWAAAAVGVKFFRGDAVRTADGTALLSIGRNAALRVQPHSLIRFGAQAGKDSIDVELGEASLEGSSGTYQLGLGGIVLDGQSTVRIVAGDGGGNRLELVLGKATIEQNGTQTAMTQGTSYELGLGEVSMVRPDAPTPDAAPVVDAAVDAVPIDAPVEVPASATVSIKGKKAQLRAPGAKQYAAVGAGTKELLADSSLRLGARTTAKASRPGITLDLPAGSRLDVGGEPFLRLVAGKVTAVGEADVEGQVAVPGGRVVLKQGGKPGGATIEIKNKRETRVIASKAPVDLVGKQRTVTLQPGDAGLILANGSVEIREEIPKHFDLRVAAGERFTVHDPRPATAIRFTFECASGGTVELAGGGQRRVSPGTDGANLSVPPGSYTYRVRCDGSSKTVKSGRVVVKRDDAHRELPRGQPPTNRLSANGKTYTVSYQNLVPNVEFSWPEGKGTGQVLHLTKGAQKKTYPATDNKVTVPGSEIRDGAYTYSFTNAAGDASKTSFLVVKFDNAVPSVYIEEPRAIAPFAAQIDVKGATLSGWSASVEGATIDVDRDGRFTAQVSSPSANALAIRLSHPRQGIHYYLRRHP